ncbi:hypothetical protein [Acinetobacter tandoii]|uniref:hypothetical protein n=1 Tax=Acinetobacter tandoii TaxID=202954 RepID=UPI003018DFAB
MWNTDPNSQGIAIESKENVNRIDINKHTQDANQKSEQDDSWKPDSNFLLNVIRESVGAHAESVLNMPDYQFHLGNFNAHWENRPDLTENQRTRKFAVWLIDKFKQRKPSTDSKSKAKHDNKNVNDDWDNQPKNDQPFHGTVQLPEGMT